ncbi:cyclic nucleotide-binding protein [Actinoplanes aureus]|uniref:Cyclic nucleotide-binding protein n=1 Tax=Actinoplanes aureus TaxID=2792083 RepID=A0A931FWW4_9ACTN|nr:cyclic nucleotide-binding protein [Actinoplanes aureus]MBG0561825.1 cyclic nucleotide-binding protein [Actinoplanes aureus]
MTYVETRTSVWEALAGRAPGVPSGPADADLWHTVAERLNPASARPVLRSGIEVRHRTAVRGGGYVMLRSPDDGGRSSYLRLTPEEYQLALMMDGVSTVARLVAEFARIAGRLAPDQVRRVVADLAANRMLEELPTDAFRPLREMVREPLPRRVGNSLLAAVRGRQILSFEVDGLITGLYRSAGRFLFTRAAVWAGGLLALVGVLLFAATWQRGSRSLFLVGDSYLLGAIALLLLNVLVLAAYELGHALAAKRVGREIPTAGLLLYFGIPSVFVDTSDVWMAGRRARIGVTAAGPATALGLAGLVQMIGLAVPATSGIAFKLAFLFYLHAFFNLSPLLPLDGHYLLMDWLEIPDLRARGLSWVSGRLRRRGPRWSALDREGRLIALYGLLAVLWLVAALGLGYRLWKDRVQGLAVGLWYSGFGGRLLLLVIVLGMIAPPLYFVLGRIGKAWRRWRQRAAERDREADLPRRLAALHASELGGLPEPAMQGLAARARWLYPPTGRQLVLAGEHQSAVYIVVEGALHGRRPGDPGGTIRHHVGPGGVVGLANALTGRSSQLDWHTAGSTLLAVPASTVATVVGPMPGPPPQERSEAEALFADTPALSALEEDQRLALIAGAHPVDLDPGAPVMLHGPTHAVVVESGVIAMPDGVELRRGTLVGPVGDGSPGMVAQARTPVRLWVIPDASDLPPLVGGYGAGGQMPVIRPSAPVAVRPGAAHPPLAVPPGPPDGTDEYDLDGHFERRMWAFASLLLVFALVSVGVNLRPGPAWAEMPGERLLLSVDSGQATALVDKESEALRSGDKRYLSAGARIEVPGSARAQLTFPGGATVVLCPGARAQVNEVAVDSGRRPAPAGRLTLDSGRLLADTTSSSGAYAELDLTVLRAQGDVTSTGRAWYAVDPSAITVASGRVAVGGAATPATTSELTCGDGVKVTPPSAGPSEEPVEGTFPATPPASAVPPAPTTPTAVPGVIRTVPPAPAGDDNDDPRPTTTSPPRTTRPTTTAAPPPGAPPTTRPTRTGTTRPTNPPPDPTTPNEPDPTTPDPTTDPPETTSPNGESSSSPG